MEEIKTTFRIVLYPGASRTCEVLALIAAKGNGLKKNINLKTLKRLFNEVKEVNEIVDVGKTEFKVLLNGKIFLLIQQAEIF